MRVYIFGASTEGESCYNQIKDFCDIMGFIDNDPNKWGRIKKDGITVYPPQELKNRNNYDVIILASIYYEEIISQLEKEGINNYIFSPISPNDLKHHKFDIYLEYCRKASEFYKKVSLLQKRIDTLNISEYSKVYFMKKNIRDIFWFADFLWNIIKYNGETHTLLDYGGGSGLLGMFASYLGIENVYYNDIHNVVCQDAKVIAKEMGIELKDYICGDIDEVIEYAKNKDIYFDAVISYNVIDHIYDLESFFKKLMQVCKRDCFISMWTSANSFKPNTVERLKNRHYQSEHCTCDSLIGNRVEHLIDFEELAKNVNSFENAFILPAYNKESSDLVAFCLQDKAYTYVLEEWIDEHERYLYRFKIYYNTLIKWLSKLAAGSRVSEWFLKRGINAIIIYGGGELGRILYKQLMKDSIINVKAVCDQNTKDLAMNFHGPRIINTEQLFEEYNQGEVIVVTPIYAFDSISQDIGERINGTIINLETIIEEM